MDLVLDDVCGSLVDMISRYYQCKLYVLDGCANAQWFCSPNGCSQRFDQLTWCIYYVQHVIMMWIDHGMGEDLVIVWVLSPIYI